MNCLFSIFQLPPCFKQCRPLGPRGQTPGCLLACCLSGCQPCHHHKHQQRQRGARITETTHVLSLACAGQLQPLTLLAIYRSNNFHLPFFLQGKQPTKCRPKCHCSFEFVDTCSACSLCDFSFPSVSGELTFQHLFLVIKKLILSN